MMLLFIENQHGEARLQDPSWPRMTRRSALLAPALVLANGARAQGFPSKTVTFVVPLQAGGPADTTARVIAQKLSGTFGSQVIVENMGGASGMLALQRVARAAPDGHTLLVGPGSFITIGPLMTAGAKIDPVASLDPVTMISKYPSALFVSTKLPVHSLADFIAFARENPGRLNFSSPGAGTQPHIACETLKRRFGFEATHVPYRGGAPSLMAVVAGDVEFSCFEPSNLAVQLAGGQIRVLALGDTRRNAALPDVPTFAELGYPDIIFNSWTAAMAPRGLPPELLLRLNALFREALAAPDVLERFKNLQIDVAVSTPDELRALQVQEIADRVPLIAALGLARE